MVVHPDNLEGPTNGVGDVLAMDSLPFAEAI